MNDIEAPPQNLTNGGGLEEGIASLMRGQWREGAKRALEAMPGPFEGVGVAAEADEAQLVRRGAAKVLPDDFVARLIIAAEGVGETADGNPEHILDDGF